MQARAGKGKGAGKSKQGGQEKVTAYARGGGGDSHLYEDGKFVKAKRVGVEKLPDMPGQAEKMKFGRERIVEVIKPEDSEEEVNQPAREVKRSNESEDTKKLAARKALEKKNTRRVTSVIDGETPLEGVLPPAPEAPDDDEEEEEPSGEPPPLDDAKMQYYSASSKMPITSMIDEKYLLAQQTTGSSKPIRENIKTNFGVTYAEQADSSR